MKQIENKRGLSEIEASWYVGLSRSTLRQGRMNGSRQGHVPPPPFVKVGRKVIYLRDDLDRYLEANRKRGPDALRGAR